MLKRIKEFFKQGCSHDWRYKSFKPDWINMVFPGRKCQKCGEEWFNPHPGGEGYPEHLHDLPPYEEKEFK